MDELATLCKGKLETFRIKELKDVLTRIGAAKHGKKQVLVDRIMTSISGKQSDSRVPIKNGQSREEVAKVIDDIFRKMWGSNAPDLATTVEVTSDAWTTTTVKKNEVSKLKQEIKVRCICSSKIKTDTMIQCDDPNCMTWQHVSCVIIPEKEGQELELPSQFYCELCRIKHGDPYCVAISHPLLPSKMVVSVPGGEGASPLQNSEKSFMLSRSDVDLIKRPQHDIQVWIVMLNDKVTFRMHWPLNTELRINGYPVRVTNRPGHQALGLNGRDDGTSIANYIREGNNHLSISASDGRPFCVGVRVIQRLTVDQVLSRIPKEHEGEPFDTAVARVRRCITGGTDNGGDNSDSDLEIVSECVSFSLRCPMSGSRMKVAGRFKHCLHMGCFDLNTFVELNQRTRKWQCPVCLTNSSLVHLIIDPFLTHILRDLQSYGEDVADIEIKPDGHWRPKLEGDSKKKEPWRLPSITTSITTDKQSEQSGCEGETLQTTSFEEDPAVENLPHKKRRRDDRWQEKGTSDQSGFLCDQNNSCTFQSQSSSMTANLTRDPDSSQDVLKASDAAETEVDSMLLAQLEKSVEVIVLSDSDDDSLEEVENSVNPAIQVQKYKDTSTPSVLRSERLACAPENVQSNQSSVPYLSNDGVENTSRKRRLIVSPGAYIDSSTDAVLPQEPCRTMDRDSSRKPPSSYFPEQQTPQRMFGSIDDTESVVANFSDHVTNSNRRTGVNSQYRARSYFRVDSDSD